MASLHIFNRNTIDTANLSGGSWLPTLPLELLREQRPSLKARSSNAQLASTQLRLQLTEPLSSHGIQLISTNLSSAARYRITWYSDQTFTLQAGTTDWVQVGETIDWNNTVEWLDWLDENFWLGSSVFIDPDNQGRDVGHYFHPDETIQYIDIEIDDTTNPDGYVEIGYLFVGRAFEPSLNILFDPSFTRLSHTSGQEAIGGAAYFNRRGSQKRLAVALQIPSEEAFGDLDNIMLIHDINKPVYVNLDHDRGYSQKTAFLARMEKMPETRLMQVFFESGDIGAAIGLEFIQVL